MSQCIKACFGFDGKNYTLLNMVADHPKNRGRPYSEKIAEEILILIENGWRLTDICKIPGVPSYNIVCRWRRENPTFQEDIIYAYKVRESSLTAQEQLAEIMKIQAPRSQRKALSDEQNHLRKQRSRQIGVRYPSLKQKIDRRRMTYVLDTGISILSIKNGRLLKCEKKN